MLWILLVGRFTTAAMASEAPVNLRSVANFAVLAGSTVTNVPGDGTRLTGDLGVSPGTAVTGSPPGIVIGTIHAGDAVAAQAQADLTTAYNDAAGRSTAPITVSGNIGGRRSIRASINPRPRWRYRQGISLSTPRATPTPSSSSRWRARSPRRPVARLS